MRKLVPLFLLILMTGCSVEPPAEDKLFDSIPSGYSGLDFENKIKETAERCIYQYDYFYNGGGVAIADLNNDGLPDVFLTGNDSPNALYWNKGALQFEQDQADFGSNFWSTGATITDINQDGWLDIYVSNSGPDWQTKSTDNLLFVNNQDGSFSEKAQEYGIDNAGLSTQGVFFDFDNDGDDDLWVVNHGVRNMANRADEWLNAFQKLPNDTKLRFCSALYRNDNGKFVDITNKSRTLHWGFGLGAAVEDFDGDGFLDIFQSNDYFIPDRLWHNNGDGTFTNQADGLGHTSFFSMGCDAADFTYDGLPDLVTLDMTPPEHFRSKTMMASMNVPEFNFINDNLEGPRQYMVNTAHWNRGYGYMTEVGHMAGIDKTDWSWAPLLADFNLDGKQDLFVTNGYWRDVKNNDKRMELTEQIKAGSMNEEAYFEWLQTIPQQGVSNYFFSNDTTLHFKDVTNDWSKPTPSFSNGAAYGDLDGDGDLDLVVNELNGKVSLLRNNSSSANASLRVRFEENGKLSSKPVWLVVESGDSTYTWFNQYSRGYQSHCNPEVVIPANLVNGDAFVKNLRGQQASTMLTPGLNIIDLSGLDFQEKLVEPKTRNNFIATREESIGRSIVHIENDYDDFLEQPLLPYAMSRLGPGFATGDFGVFVGGAVGKRSRVFSLEYTERKEIKQPLLSQMREAEDIGAHAFDFNGDGRDDLYIARGGGGDVKNEALLEDVLLITNRKGEFVKAIESPANSSSKAILSLDIDDDGDLDLIVGGRNVPGKYPSTPMSFVLRNDGDKLTDVTDEVVPQFRNVGMVTDMVICDWNQDEKQDFVVVGEWMAPTVFLATADGYEKLASDYLESLTGWWQCVEVKWGGGLSYPDLILGNMGLSPKYAPGNGKVLRAYGDDFDDSGTWDIVMAQEKKGKVLPVRGRECSSMQMPFVADKFETYESFANAELDDIYELNRAVEVEAREFRSGRLINLGDELSFEPFPREAQSMVVRSILIGDLNWDWNTGGADLILVGNITHTEPETPGFNSSAGLCLMGDKSGKFTSINPLNHELKLTGDVVSIHWMNGHKGARPEFYVVRNSGEVECWTITKVTHRNER